MLLNVEKYVGRVGVLAILLGGGVWLSAPATCGVARADGPDSSSTSGHAGPGGRPGAERRAVAGPVRKVTVPSAGPTERAAAQRSGGARSAVAVSGGVTAARRIATGTGGAPKGVPESSLVESLLFAGARRESSARERYAVASPRVAVLAPGANASVVARAQANANPLDAVISGIRNLISSVINGATSFVNGFVSAVNHVITTVLRAAGLYPGPDPHVGPVAVDDAFTVEEEQPLVLTAEQLLANDTHPNGDALVIAAVSNPVHGAVVLSEGGTVVTFTPAAGYFGAASFDYWAQDTAGTASTATVTVTVTAAPGAPVAVDDAFTVGGNTPLVLTAEQLLANDSDPDGGALVIATVSNSVHGAVAVSEDRTVVTFTPTAGYAGPASFDYWVQDTAGFVRSATVSVTVTVAPDAVDDAFTVRENTPLQLTAGQLLANDTHPEGDGLVVAEVLGATHGDVVLSEGGTVVTVTPAPGYVGEVSFDYLAQDTAGAGNWATVRVTVTAPPDVSGVAGWDTPLADSVRNYASMVLSPDGRYVYAVTDVLSGNVLDHNTVTVIDTATGAIVTSIPVGIIGYAGGSEGGLVVGPDSRYVYALHYDPGTVASSLAVIDADADGGPALIDTINFGGDVAGLAVGSGRYLYASGSVADYDDEGVVVSRENTVWVVDADADGGPALVATISIGAPEDTEIGSVLEVTPDGSYAFSASSAGMWAIKPGIDPDSGEVTTTVTRVVAPSGFSSWWPGTVVSTNRYAYVTSGSDLFFGYIKTLSVIDLTGPTPVAVKSFSAEGASEITVVVGPVGDVAYAIVGKHEYDAGGRGAVVWAIGPEAGSDPAVVTTVGWDDSLGPIAFSPDGEYVAVGVATGDGHAVRTIRVSDNSVTTVAVGEPGVGEPGVYQVVWSPDGRWAYATSGGANPYQSLVTVLDTTNTYAPRDFTVSGDAHVVVADNGFAYVTSGFPNGRVYVVDPESGEIAGWSTGGLPQVVVSPDSPGAYLTGNYPDGDDGWFTRVMKIDTTTITA